MNNFKLEEKWCIEVTKENSLIVGEYFKVVSSVYENWWEKEIVHRGVRHRKFLRSHNDNDEPVIKGSDSSFSSLDLEGQLLTTEQFIKYVLNKEVPATIQSEEYNNILIKLLTK